MLPLGTDVIEFEITPNRPDCLGIYGIAREVHAATDAPLAPPPWTADPGSAEGDVGGVEIVVECPDLVPAIHGAGVRRHPDRPVTGLAQGRPVAAGMRPINNVVDITNYVMLLTGQPLHAFDLDRVAGRALVVRRAGDGEPVETLDGQTRTLDAEMVVICDADGPTSIAGIMGGARSEVEPQTTRVLIEAATWIGANIQRSSPRLGLRSEASGRFEKGLEPEVGGGRPGARHAAADRVLRRPGAHRDDRRRRPRAAAARDPPAEARVRGAARRPDRPRPLGRDPHVAWLRRRRRAGRRASTCTVPAFRRADVTARST